GRGQRLVVQARVQQRVRRGGDPADEQDGEHRQGDDRRDDHHPVGDGQVADEVGDALLDVAHQTCNLMISWYASTARLRTCTSRSTDSCALDVAVIRSWIS